MPDKSNFVAIGQIIKPHGVHGEFKVLPLTDFIEERFSNLKDFFIFNENDGAVKCSVVSVKFTPRYVIVGAEGFTIERAEALREQYIYIEKKDIMDAGEDNFYAFDLVGLAVIENATGRRLGEIINVYSGSGNDMIEISIAGDAGGDAKTALVPFVKQFVKKIDIKGGAVYIEVLEGLL
ncbi:MAG: 16S rRNA processing protein RimM [Candidatus Wallbacteria bacterium GWC2_49_35]|uniref:Ribosome maturation factor RimM n=1 Tax=Candidatus Wallbacteria bacterium GWC2_49_35 TaxID=1817813 RepID=A0A1F7WM46_9BACT|nr:MAG: 16S rRNA processing protein RimM [Candidatus Wallbacteria bacterium GWC2_49_35]HBC76973.1 16S rRNA processing protein RimM [Candidatus Wallbacteria bacterium]